jgi:hypothetical protein
VSNFDQTGEQYRTETRFAPGYKECASGLRLFETAACKVAGISKMEHESAMDFEAASGRLVSFFSSAALLAFD